MRYVAGLDGGGTKTAVTVLSVEDGRKEEAFFGPMNVNSSGSAQVENTVKDSFDWIAGKYGLDNLVSVCIGTAGISNPKAAALLQEAVGRCGYQKKLLLLGDHETALAGALSGRDGVVLIAGTGSICVGYAEGRSARAGGFGHLIDDEGSGYAVGRDILGAAVRSFDARKGETCLTEAVFERLCIKELPELIRFVYDPLTTKKEIAGLASLLGDALEKQDQEALRIVSKAAENLFSLADSVIAMLGLQEKEIAFLGSVLEHCAPIQEKVICLLQEKYNKLRFTKPENEASMGAALCALREYNRRH